VMLSLLIVGSILLVSVIISLILSRKKVTG